MARKATGNALTIGIIGGRGDMGRLFRKFFSSIGYKVLVSGRRTKLSKTELAVKCDVVIISVPVSAAQKIAREIAPHMRKGCLLADFTAVKSPVIKEMLKADKDVAVIGIHPLFGPSVSSMRKQNFVIVPARVVGKWLSWLKGIVNHAGGKATIATADEHDRMMAVIQVLCHFSALSAGKAFEHSIPSFRKSLGFSTPFYKLSTELIRMMVMQDPQVYSEIAFYNPYSRKVLDKLADSSEELRKIVSKRDSRAYERYFKRVAEFFGR